MRRAHLVLSTLTTLAAGFVAAVPASAATTFTSTMVNAGDGSCATVPNPNSAVQLTLAACGSGAGQSFTFTPVSGDVYSVGTFTSGSCLDVFGASTADNAAVIQYACHSGTNQQFRLRATGTANTFTVVAVSSGKCVAPSGSTLVQLPCTSNLVWRLSGFDPGSPTDTYQGIPNLAPNACRNSSLPRSYGTNFQTPNDPNGRGFFNTTAIGWDGNYWPVTTYRGPATGSSRTTTRCEPAASRRTPTTTTTSPATTAPAWSRRRSSPTRSTSTTARRCT